jgi:hypothetical protein
MTQQKASKLVEAPVLELPVWYFAGSAAIASLSSLHKQKRRPEGRRFCI